MTAGFEKAIGSQDGSLMGSLDGSHGWLVFGRPFWETIFLGSQKKPNVWGLKKNGFSNDELKKHQQKNRCLGLKMSFLK